VNNSDAAKLLPKGRTWLYFKRLPSNTTDVTFQSFLREHGIELSLDHISMKDMDGGFSSALIAVPNKVVQMLVAWAINGDTLGGRQVVPELLLGDSRSTKLLNEIGVYHG
jgi:hypothetical protein